MSKLRIMALAGLAMLAACLVVGFIPRHAPDGRNCGSVLGPGRHGSEVCRDARADWLPAVVILLALAAALLIAALVIWWRHFEPADRPEQPRE